ncbi:MAG: hypothetical protein MZV64_04550 [Ignavibacteriales bacterium]|nr:hypothetical protein [Ignavibacteriales bacterium]
MPAKRPQRGGAGPLGEGRVCWSRGTRDRWLIGVSVLAHGQPRHAPSASCAPARPASGGAPAAPRCAIDHAGHVERLRRRPQRRRDRGSCAAEVQPAAPRRPAGGPAGRRPCPRYASGESERGFAVHPAGFHGVPAGPSPHAAGLQAGHGVGAEVLCPSYRLTLTNT